MIRALLIGLLGMIIGPAIVTICLFVAAHGFVAGEPLDGGGWASVGIFGGLAMIIVLIGFSAWRSDRRAALDPDASDPPGRGVTKLVPVLMIVGVLAGGALGFMWSNARIAQLHSIDSMNCRTAFGQGEPPADCPRTARACRHADLDLAEVDFPGGVPTPVWPRELRPSPLPESRARVLCIYRKYH